VRFAKADDKAASHPPPLAPTFRGGRPHEGPPEAPVSSRGRSSGRSGRRAHESGRSCRYVSELVPKHVPGSSSIPRE
jgi:hypothetical protein